MTPEEKAEKYIEAQHYEPYEKVCTKAKVNEIKQAYLAPYADAEGIEAGRVAESNRQEIANSLRRSVVRRTDYERCLDKGDTLDYDIEPEHS